MFPIRKQDYEKKVKKKYFLTFYSILRFIGLTSGLFLLRSCHPQSPPNKHLFRSLVDAKT